MLKWKKCQSGIDGMRFECSLELEGVDCRSWPDDKELNAAGKTVFEIHGLKGKVQLNMNLAHGIRPNNIKPFSIDDAVQLDSMRLRTVAFIQRYLRKNLQAAYSGDLVKQLRLTELECNITIPCVDGATPSDVINLLDLSHDKTTVFRRQKTEAEIKKINTGWMYSKPKEYRLKIYDKTVEQHERGNPLVAANMLRVEVIFINRALARMFGEKRGIDDILTEEALKKLCQEYKRVLVEEVIEGSLKPCLRYCTQKLLAALLESEVKNTLSEVVAKHRELIPDIEVLRRALQRWYRERGVEDQSKQNIHLYRKKGLGLPEGAVKTVKAFHDAMG